MGRKAGCGTFGIVAATGAGPGIAFGGGAAGIPTGPRPRTGGVTPRMFEIMAGAGIGPRPRIAGAGPAMGRSSGPAVAPPPGGSAAGPGVGATGGLAGRGTPESAAARWVSGPHWSGGFLKNSSRIGFGEVIGSQSLFKLNFTAKKRFCLRMFQRHFMSTRVPPSASSTRPRSGLPCRATTGTCVRLRECGQARPVPRDTIPGQPVGRILARLHTSPTRIVKRNGLREMGKGLQNLYAWVRLPPAPPTLSYSKQITYLFRVHPTVPDFVQNGSQLPCFQWLPKRRFRLGDNWLLRNPASAL